MLRIFDLVFSLLGLFFGSPVLLAIFVVAFFDTASPLLVQERMGRGKKSFKLIKFRTMTKDTAWVASHLVSYSSITRLGGFLRRSKLDELPQLWNVLVGDMSLVGPRPNLLNQDELIRVRDALGVYSVRPGITGLAQISKIDMSTPALLAKTDRELIDTLTMKSYLRYIGITLLGHGGGDRAS